MNFQTKVVQWAKSHARDFLEIWLWKTFSNPQTPFSNSETVPKAVPDPQIFYKTFPKYFTIFQINSIILDSHQTYLVNKRKMFWNKFKVCKVIMKLDNTSVIGKLFRVARALPKPKINPKEEFILGYQRLTRS